MPFDYQMVTYEEIIKYDFFKWAQLVKTTAFVNLKLNIKYFTKAVVSNFLKFLSTAKAQLVILFSFAVKLFLKEHKCAPRGAHLCHK